MKNIGLYLIYIILLPVILFVFTTLSSGEPLRQNKVSTSHKIIKKFARGIANSLTAPVELIKQPLKESDKADTIIGVPAGCLTGFITGIGWMFYRMGTGIFDIITFPLPVNDYESLIEPEFII